MNRCLYCGAEIPDIEEDSLGRRPAKKAHFCRGTDHYLLWWYKQNKQYRNKIDHGVYIKRKEEGYFKKENKNG